MRSAAVSSEPAFELDPETLKTVENLQTRMYVDAIVGKTIASAEMSRGRASISTTDGTTLVFCGFHGTSPADG